MTFDQTPVSEREKSSNSASKVSNRKLVVVSCGVVLFVVLIGAGVWWWAIRGVEDKVANVEMAEEVTRSYVEALHNGKVGSAYGLLAEEVRSRQSQEEYASFLKADPNSGVIEKYEGLEICEYQFGDKGMVTAIGLLHYEGGDIYFVSNLVEGSDKAWGIYKFYTDSEVEPKPWAGCLFEGQ
jgi:hypothetical protein